MKCKRNKGGNDAKKVAFTLAEVLITLGIIGVVVALIMPTVISKTKDKQYKAARAKALSTIGNASKNIAVQGNMNDAQNAKDFVNNILRSQIAIAKTCENDELENCGIPAKYKTGLGYEYSMPKKVQDLFVFGMPGINTIEKSKSYGFLTGDGYAYNLFYFPECSEEPLNLTSIIKNGRSLLCVNAIYDMNGLRGPNQVGKDIGFVTVFYPNEKVQAVAPMFIGTPDDVYEFGLTYLEAQQFCAEKGKRLPNFEEGMSAEFNSSISGFGGSPMLTSSTEGPRALFPSGIFSPIRVFSDSQTLCVE